MHGTVANIVAESTGKSVQQLFGQVEEFQHQIAQHCYPHTYRLHVSQHLVGS